MTGFILGVCASITAPQAWAQDRLVVQQAPAEIRRGTDADAKETAGSTTSNTETASGEVPPIISLLLEDGSWRVGRLESIGTDGWRLLVRAAGGTEPLLVPIDDAIAFVIRRNSLRPALGSDAETHNCAEGSLLQVAPLSLGVIDTNDGQRLPGTFRIANGTAVWDHRWIGTIPVSLDRISSLRMIADRRAPGSAEGDTILLLNGDVVRGFIDTIADEITVSPLDSPVGSGGVFNSGSLPKPERLVQDSGEPTPKSEVVTPAGNGDPDRDAGDPDREKRASDRALETPNGDRRRIPMERVAALTLAEMPTEPRSGTEVWTSDGSIVGAENLAFTTPVGWSFTLGSDWLRGVRSRPTSDNQAADPLAGVLDRDRFLPLAACQRGVGSSSSALGYRYRSDRPARLRDSARFLLGCTEIEIDGPTSISFKIPDRFIATNAVLTGMLSIAEPCPSDARVEVLVSFGGTSGERIVLDGARRCQSFTMRSQGDIASGVSISISDGGNGVVGDRIVLERTALIAPK
ncbi:MAG: hypothetical protein ACKO3W_15605 [bacterium]